MSFSIGGEGFDDPSDFNATVFQNLDEHLRCPICKEFFDTTMILSTCSHSFCALCIRRSLSAEQICPKCRKPASDNHLLHNYDLDHVVSTWRQSRTLLLDIDKMAITPPLIKYPSSDSKSLPSLIHDDDFVPDHTNASTPSITAPTRRSTRIGSQPQPVYSLKSKTPIEAQTTSPPPPPPPPPPLILKQEQYNPPVLPPVPFQQQQPAPVEAEPLKSTSLVECPICLNKMKYLVLDIHLDRCMKGDSRIPNDPIPHVSASRLPTNATSPTPLYNNTQMFPSILKKQKPVDLGRKPSKVVYNMLSDKDLKSILKEIGLPDHGDRSQRIWRHKEYINLYNANYDSINPVSYQTLIQRLSSLEYSYINDKNNASKRKTPDSDAHRQKYKSEFEMLIEDAKRRRKAHDHSEASSQNDSNDDNKDVQ